MLVYRIVKSEKRTKDISGTGAFNEGGRWNNEGVYALYTSENEALALIEILANVERAELPPHLFIMTIQISDKAPIYEIPDKKLPKNWRLPDNIFLKEWGSRIFFENDFIGIKALSAVMQTSYNYILNPRFHQYNKLIKVIKIKELELDTRFR
jgi:RES domain-containing protein